MKLLIKLTKISLTDHRFEYLREDATGEKLELETKGFLFHDLLHFAVESEAKLVDSFYGLLYKNKKYEDLIPKQNENGSNYFDGEAGMTEKIVGPLSSLIKDGVTAQDFLSGMQNMLDAYGQEKPDWLTLEFIGNVKERMRKLLGEWKALPFGKTMELIFEIK